MKRLIQIAVYMALTISILILFAVFVWPTEWKILPVKTIREEQFQQRQNRFTSQVETWIPAQINKVGGYYVGDKAGTWTQDY
jgi:ABC-type transport system involved in cytochrome bd biosynthesis fused ATPase/permease subunit